MGVGAAVVVLSNELDVGADLVVVELDRRGVTVLRCNTERFPAWRVDLVPGEAWRLTDTFGRIAESEAVSGVWWRRPARPSSGPAAALDGEEAARDEQWQAFAEGLASVPIRGCWVSEPAAIRRAEDKAVQLRAAREVGFSVPATLVTNDVNQARAFLEDRGAAAVAKSLTAAFWTEGGASSFIYARLVTEADLPENPTAFAAVPVVLQAAIHPKQDVRVTVVGDRVLTAVAERDHVLDWRLRPERPWRAYEPPASVANAAIELVRGLGLQFGGIDIAIDEFGEHWFLEINPNGEWGWLERMAGLPVAAALADLLAAGSSR